MLLIMGNLIGSYRGTNQNVTTDDNDDRKMSIIMLYDALGWDMYSNPKEGAIDLLYKDGRPGGSDLESGKYHGLYINQDPQTFNQFTLPFPTGNVSERKEKYLNENYKWYTDYGNVIYYHFPDFEYNSIFRPNAEFNEFFIVDYELYKQNLKIRGHFKPSTVYKVDPITGKPIREFWMCWEIKYLPFYVKENGVWRRDTTFDDPKVYKDFVDNYTIEREKYFKSHPYELQKSIY